MPRPRKDPNDPKWADAPTIPERVRVYPSRASAPRPVKPALAADDDAGDFAQPQQEPRAPAPMGDLAAADLARYDALLVAEEAARVSGTVSEQYRHKQTAREIRAEMDAAGQMDRARVREIARGK